MKIILSGGGTGGHIYPALALIRQLQKVEPTLDVLYVGTEKGLEKKIVEKAGIPFKAVEVQGFKRSLSFENVKTVQLFFKSVSDSKKIVKEFQPDIVIGTGGYVCAPVVYAAAKQGIPTIIHEQNSVAGVTNKFLSKYASKIAICFEEARQEFAKFPEKIVLTGNPRAQEVASIQQSTILEEYQLKADYPTLLIFGGSRGARKINEAFVAALPELVKKEYQILFATGEVHYQKIQEELAILADKDSNVSVVPFIYNMPEVFANVSLVMARSGATSLAELTALGLPSILIPSPYVTNDHQTRNAESLTTHGAAEMIADVDLTGERLILEVDQLMMNPDKRLKMAGEAKKLGIPDAADRLVALIRELI
ncbi:undecaprenyldiphospho-muramoylpentapeptide beta-N-acetylglucosaminyltransferase [Carnobacterium gallinarum]|uniref:undecaprenyldiphospho-muramoylpentapeptide beta-N-acetylglucosaminyltransferase n=1 Tax=Carnobacterium gallinarum TaxID=2749 RepID=UPI0005568162|nr:undecaprenyldiphospho-muramoylpentapeptide beta-N-acetylglucosaminyltransferase [Carnobacterium gallinarum]